MSGYKQRSVGYAPMQIHYELRSHSSRSKRRRIRHAHIEPCKSYHHKRVQKTRRRFQKIRARLFGDKPFVFSDFNRRLPDFLIRPKTFIPLRNGRVTRTEKNGLRRVVTVFQRREKILFRFHHVPSYRNAFVVTKS